jgi:hypothetical protein
MSGGRQAKERMKLNNIVLHGIFKEKNMGFCDQLGFFLTG